MFFVDLPSEVEVGITALMVSLFSLIVQYLIANFRILSWLEAYKQEWGFALSVVYIGWLESVLPASHPEAAVLAVQLVLALFAGFGFVKKLAIKSGVKGFMDKPKG